MPWVRIDENAMEHRKILVLSAEAFRLWVRGLAHCQKHLTDGLITFVELKTIRGVTPARVHELTTPVRDGESPLWSADEQGYRVHDYLEWNDSKEHVLRARAFAKERIKKLRNKTKRNAVPNAEQIGDVTGTATSVVVCSSSGSEVNKRKAAETIDERASAFSEWYQDAHQRVIGIGYMGANGDWPTCRELCRKFTDEQLHDAAFVWFGMRDAFALKGNRTITKFASRISECLQKAAVA